MKKMEGEDFDQLVRFFDGMATTNWLSSVHKQLKEATGIWKEKKVLDVGCGTGRFLLRGVKEASHVVGIDLSSEMIKACKQTFTSHEVDEKATFVVGDAYKLPFEDDEFDIAVSTCVLFLLPEPMIAMEEMIRVIKEDGMIAMLNPSLKMNQEEALRYCNDHGLTDFEQKTLLQWSTISTSRHTFSTDQLIDYFTESGAEKVTNIKVLNDLAIITIAKF
ncbi:class I SAM-dependent methyltransferase [Anaerobacillus isosaccharinicus]|uniref:SAM-dependent methyltransferase n=1 Tax=Anaerobacillus isosaccharinicus TaxID=1532552 RepID=A0A1S2MA60_9BACI|nr:class I SAM-dependent methyltransferase [Anaerobacillus isosaccharinicus]MBA5587405.1 class I SAM-dependent methyltransferase [Anaerobacillus isosaccharinicus]QOY34406.1 class I SAM-dependent methyltransferase [Anaerobacillus isosaccharinicus]